MHVIDLKTGPVEDLPVGVQQRVEIVKALLRQASVLILDEPTSVLTPGEIQELFRIMRDLQAGGRSLVFISHKLKEVQEIADTITVIRRGQVVGQRPPTARSTSTPCQRSLSCMPDNTSRVSRVPKLNSRCDCGSGSKPAPSDSRRLSVSGLVNAE